MKIADIQKYFNNASKTYNDNCFIQYKTGNYLINMLKNHNYNFKKIIDFGCGTGLVTSELAKLYVNSEEIYAIDIAVNLLEEASKNLQDTKIIFQRENFEDFSAKFQKRKFDLIFSNMALQWSNNLEETIISLKEKLSQNGILAFSITLDNSLKELEGIKKIPFLSKNNIPKILQENNMLLVECQNLLDIYQYKSLKEALKSIKLVGANYSEDKIANMAAIRRLYKLEKGKIEKKFNISYNIGIFLAKKN